MYKIVFYVPSTGERGYCIDPYGSTDDNFSTKHKSFAKLVLLDIKDYGKIHFPERTYTIVKEVA